VKLHPYQERAVAHLQKGSAGLFLDMGLGKTASVLSALKPEDLPVLVVAPKRVAEHVWGAERAIWRPDLSITVVAGNGYQRNNVITSAAEERKSLLAVETDITVISRDNLKDVNPGRREGRRWNTLVIDESSGFKDPGSIRWRLAIHIARHMNKRWIMTGTPTPNGYLDLWSQVYLLDFGKRLGAGNRLGEGVGRYKDRYFYQDIHKGKNGQSYPGDWHLKPGAEKRISMLISDICLSMSAADYLDLPPIVYNTVEVALPKSAMGVYKQMEKTLVSDLRLIGEGAIHSAANAAVLTGKLSQVSAGFMYSDMGSAPSILHREKLDAVREIMEGTGSPILVFYRFQEELDMLLKLPGSRDVKQKGAIDDWNAGKVPVLLAHPQSAGHGLNLQHGGHTVVWTSLSWSLEDWQQANGRLHRQGQREAVTVHVLEAIDTIDRRIRDVLDGKESVQTALLNYLKG
jgi:SNF2 family DNA or RNA helicase